MVVKPLPHTGLYGAHDISLPPFDQHAIDEKERELLLSIAKSNSEKFARALMQAASALDSNSGDGTDSAIPDLGVEFVDTLNGIDIYEEVTHPHGTSANNATSDTASPSTRLRSVCHIEMDIKGVLCRLSSAASPHLLPGIVETRELCSILPPDRSIDKPHPIAEHAGINWFVLNREATRDSGSNNGADIIDEDPVDEPRFDFVALSYQGVFKHRQRRGWVQWCQSIELPSFSKLGHKRYTKRGGLFSSGIVAVESATRPGQVSVCFAMGVDLRDCDARERHFLESIVWKRVMKLAALKKSLVRDSLTRTISLSSTNSSSENRETQTRQPECEPGRDDSRDLTCDKSEKTSKLDLMRLKPVPRMLARPDAAQLIAERKALAAVMAADSVPRPRAQTLQSFRHPAQNSNSMIREPSSLEFRLTFYNDPDCEGVLRDEDTGLKGHTTSHGGLRPKSKSVWD